MALVNNGLIKTTTFIIVFASMCRKMSTIHNQGNDGYLCSMTMNYMSQSKDVIIKAKGYNAKIMLTPMKHHTSDRLLQGGEI